MSIPKKEIKKAERDKRSALIFLQTPWGLFLKQSLRARHLRDERSFLQPLVHSQ